MATGLQIKVGADTTEFKQEIRQLPKEFQKAEAEITQSAENMGGALGGALKGIVSVGTVVAMERLINHFDKVADAASKYGETAEDIQRVGIAAEMTGGNIDTIAMAMERAGVAAAKAARGNQEFLEKFDRAGIDAAAFSTATLTERVEMVARAQQEAGTAGDRHSAILEAVGDSAAGIDFQRIADEMGNVIVASNEAVNQISRANDIMHQGKNIAMVFGAEGLGAIADGFERIGSILGQADDGVLGKIAAFNKIASKFTPMAGINSLLGRGGETIKEMEDAEKRMNAIALLGSREGIDNATEEQIKAEMEAIVEREKAASRATTTTNEAIDQGKEKTEQNAKIKQRLLEISLQLKEAEAANNSELVAHLKHSEDLFKGILKYKDAEDAYGMALREANAELEKRNKITSAGQVSGMQEIVAIRQAYIDSMSKSSVGMSAAERSKRDEASRKYFDLTRNNPELLRPDVQGRMSDLAKSGGAAADPIKQVVAALISGLAERSMQSAGMTEPERQRAEALSRAPGPADKTTQAATESTLQMAVEFLKELTGKLPQPVLA